MPTTFSPEELKAMFTGKKLSNTYQEALELHNKLRVHADGEVPIKLIKNARPNESEQVRTYREGIYEAETQNPVERVLGVLEKIRRSPDWMIRFDHESPAIISDDETLSNYITERYPLYGHIENWLFEEALHNVALDANAVIVVMPEQLEAPGNSYVKPIAKVFNAKDVLDFVGDDYAILKSEEFSELLSVDKRIQRYKAATMIKGEDFIVGQVYYVITTKYYQRWEENSEGKYQLTKQLIHNLNALPAFQIPGKFVKRVGKNVLKKTPLYAMVPHLNKAARESNDLDAGVIMHLYLEKWRINNVPCSKCNGIGKVATGQSCSECKGSGIANGKSPFNEMIIKPAKIGEQNIPTPPIGYVQKDTKIIEIQSKRIEEHLYKALSAVNMEHLAEVQLSQSGVAKQYDRDEVNNLIYNFADSLATIANTVIYFICELRYSFLIADKEKRKLLLPVIPVPEKYDVINTTFLLGEYQVGKTAGLNSIILSEMQKELAEKKFYSNPAISKFVRTIMDIDPFPDKTIEDKNMMQSQGLATKEDVILSNYLPAFVKLAMETDKGFLDKKLSEKRDALLVYAKAKTVELNTARTLAMDIIGDGAKEE